MSRVGKLPVAIPEQIKIQVTDKEVKFDNGKLNRVYHVRPNVEVNYADNQIKLTAKNGNKSYSIDVGMDRSNINNIVSGMMKPFEILLEVNGVGYKASVNQRMIILTLGYSHEIFYSLPEAVTAVFEKPNIIRLTSYDKILVGQVASEIIAFRKPEPYKGKGVKIAGSKILRKEGKKK
jgi:large subunit ribosomal protein L6